MRVPCHLWCTHRTSLMWEKLFQFSCGFKNSIQVGPLVFFLELSRRTLWNRVCFSVWLHCKILTPIFRSPPRVTLVMRFPIPCFRFSLFPFRNSPRLEGNTHNEFRIINPQCKTLSLQMCAFRFGAVRITFFISQIKWWNISFKWLWNTKSDCGSVNSCRVSHTDVGCWGMTVILTGSFWCTFSMYNHSRFSF